MDIWYRGLDGGFFINLAPLLPIGTAGSSCEVPGSPPVGGSALAAPFGGSAPDVPGLVPLDGSDRDAPLDGVPFDVPGSPPLSGSIREAPFGGAALDAPPLPPLPFVGAGFATCRFRGFWNRVILAQILLVYYSSPLSG